MSEDRFELLKDKKQQFLAASISEIKNLISISEVSDVLGIMSLQNHLQELQNELKDLQEFEQLNKKIEEEVLINGIEVGRIYEAMQLLQSAGLDTTSVCGSLSHAFSKLENNDT